MRGMRTMACCPLPRRRKCTVEWKSGEQRFKCPCHGSRFDRHGLRVASPAERPLDLMAIERQPNGVIQIDTASITERWG
jgi:cytochrome b6-f complex iron-sulfur subunit